MISNFWNWILCEKRQIKWCTFSLNKKSPDSFLNQVILKIPGCIKSVLWTRSRRILGFGGAPTSGSWQWIATNIACSFYIKQKRKIFSKDSIASLSTTSFGKQGLRIYKAVTLVGAMPQILWTVMEHHRLCTVEYNHFLVQNSFTDFINRIKRN